MHGWGEASRRAAKGLECGTFASERKQSLRAPGARSAGRALYGRAEDRRNLALGLESGSSASGRRSETGGSPTTRARHLGDGVIW